MSLWRATGYGLQPFLTAPSNATPRRLILERWPKHGKGCFFALAMMSLIALATSFSTWIIGKIVDGIFIAHELEAVWEVAAIMAIYAVAFLKDAPIILLEATSARDSESEQAIQKALKTLCEGRHAVMIGHRLSTVARADEICALDRGRLAERALHGASGPGPDLRRHRPDAVLA